MLNEKQKKQLKNIGGDALEFDCPMKEYTTFRVGGKAETLYRPTDLAELQRMMSFLDKENIPCLVVGKGSNLLVRNGGLKGVVIVLRGKLSELAMVEEGDNGILVGGGLTNSKLLQYCAQKGLGGLEFLAGIPGTVGGAVAMNAGAWGNEIGQRVRGIETVTREGSIAKFNHSQLQFHYRKLSLPIGTVITKAIFDINRETSEVVAKRVKDYLERRRSIQPLDYPSAGSVFKNPPNQFAGRLIERAGLKGEKVGGAMISDKHANFIVNTGGAKASDILALMDLARNRVREQTGIELEPEIRVLG